jgi:hypothetical protein
VVAIRRLAPSSTPASSLTTRRPSLPSGTTKATNAAGLHTVLAAALPDCSASAGVVCHVRRHSHNNRDGPQLPNGRSEESDGDQDSTERDGAGELNGAADGYASDADGVLRVSRFFAEEHGLASGDAVQLKPLAKDAIVLDRVVLVARTQSAYRLATKKGTLFMYLIQVCVNK